MFNCTVQWHTYVHTVMQLTTRTDWVWPRNWTGSGVRPQVNKMLSWNQPYWTSLLAQGLRFPASNAGVARVLSLAGKWRSRMSGGTAKKCKINKYNFFNEVNFSKDNLELQWPQWRTFFFFSSTSLLLPTHLPPPLCTQAQSCNPVDCSPPGSSVHGLFQARILEWFAISFSTQWRTSNHLRWPYPVTRCPREKGLSQELTMKGQESYFSSFTVSGDQDETHWDTSLARNPADGIMRKLAQAWQRVTGLNKVRSPGSVEHG